MNNLGLRYVSCEQAQRLDNQPIGDIAMNAPLPDHIRKALEKASLDDKYALSEAAPS